MHNKVVFQAAKALHQRGITVLRFNFRGVELSEGMHDRGQGEQDDVRAGLITLRPNFPGGRFCWLDSASARGWGCE